MPHASYFILHAFYLTGLLAPMDGLLRLAFCMQPASLEQPLLQAFLLLLAGSTYVYIDGLEQPALYATYAGRSDAVDLGPSRAAKYS